MYYKGKSNVSEWKIDAESSIFCSAWASLCLMCQTSRGLCTYMYNTSPAFDQQLKARGSLQMGCMFLTGLYYTATRTSIGTSPRACTRVLLQRVRLRSVRIVQKIEILVYSKFFLFLCREKCRSFFSSVFVSVHPLLCSGPIDPIHSISINTKVPGTTTAAVYLVLIVVTGIVHWIHAWCTRCTRTVRVYFVHV